MKKLDFTPKVSEAFYACQTKTRRQASLSVDLAAYFKQFRDADRRSLSRLQIALHQSRRSETPADLKP